MEQSGGGGAPQPPTSPPDVTVEDTSRLPLLHGVNVPVVSSSPLTVVGMLGGLERVAAACRGEARKLEVGERLTRGAAD
jgi:hypothetical protein